MRTFTAIVNPQAGATGKVRRSVDAKLRPVAELLHATGTKVTVEHSRSLAHAAGIAETAADRGDVVLAVGGDGTVGALAQAVVRAGGVLGIVPAGRGNDFARQLGLPGDPKTLSRLLSETEPREVDVIEVAGQIVVGSVYTGIDAVANRYFNRARILGAAGYHYSAFRALVGWRPADYRVTIDGTTHHQRGYTVVAANSGYYGNGRHAAPDARVDDGLLDIVSLTDVSKPAFVSVAMREIYTGVHVRRPEVVVMRGREVTIEADRHLPVGADGELIGTLPVTVRLLPGALRVLAARHIS